MPASSKAMVRMLARLSMPGAIDEIRTAEAEIARGEAIGAEELRRLMAERARQLHPIRMIGTVASG